MTKERGTVGSVTDRRRMAEAPDEALGQFELSELRGDVGWVRIGGREVRHQARDPNRRVRAKISQELRQVVDRNAEPAHTRIDLEVYVDRSVLRNRLERASFGDVVEHGREPRSDDLAMGTAIDPVQNQDGPIDAGLAKLEPFFGQGDTKAIDALALKSPRDGHDAVPVGIGFDDREHLSTSSRLADDPKIVTDDVEEHLGAGRTQGGLGALRTRSEGALRTGLHGFGLPADPFRVKHWRRNPSGLTLAPR